MEFLKSRITKRTLATRDVAMALITIASLLVNRISLRVWKFGTERLLTQICPGSSSSYTSLQADGPSHRIQQEDRAKLPFASPIDRRTTSRPRKSPGRRGRRSRIHRYNREGE